MQATLQLGPQAVNSRVHLMHPWCCNMLHSRGVVSIHSQSHVLKARRRVLLHRSNRH